MAESLAGQDAIRAAFTGDTARAQERLHNSVAAYKDYYSFFLFDTSGTIVAGFTSEGKDLTGGGRKERDYVKAILAGQDLVFSKSVFKATTGNELIYVVAKAVRDANGKLLGGVAACACGTALPPPPSIPSVSANAATASCSTIPAT